MAGQRQPIALVEQKGRKHLTKAEIEQRKNSEVKAPNDKVKPPSYLDKKLKSKFKKIAKELIALDIISNLDCDALARLLIVEDDFLKITEQIKNTDMMVEATLTEEKEIDGEIRKVKVKVLQVNEEYNKLQIMRDRCWKQVRQGAADFGLTISSRCRLVVPKVEEKKENRFMKHAK